jgi:hypothetical protein
MQFKLIKSASPLAVPYSRPANDPNSHSYVDLKRIREQISLIPEIRAWPELERTLRNQFARAAPVIHAEFPGTSKFGWTICREPKTLTATRASLNDSKTEPASAGQTSETVACISNSAKVSLIATNLIGASHSGLSFGTASLRPKPTTGGQRPWNSSAYFFSKMALLFWLSDLEGVMHDFLEPRNERKGNLNFGLLLKIMDQLAELSSDYGGLIMTDRFFALAPEEIRAMGDQKTSYYIDAHFQFLADRGYVELGQPTMMICVRSVKLTAEGQMFIQPELAEFGQPPMLTQVVNYLENTIEVSPKPNDEKAGMIVKLRDAIASQATDVIAKTIAEIGVRFLRGGA